MSWNHGQHHKQSVSTQQPSSNVCPFHLYPSIQPLLTSHSLLYCRWIHEGVWINSNSSVRNWQHYYVYCLIAKGDRQQNLRYGYTTKVCESVVQTCEKPVVYSLLCPVFMCVDQVTCIQTYICPMGVSQSYRGKCWTLCAGQCVQTLLWGRYRNRHAKFKSLEQTRSHELEIGLSAYKCDKWDGRKDRTMAQTPLCNVLHYISNSWK